jgi:catechol 2,3-dioxygenase-like lactoylglutathione lyase family enzyme
VIVFKNPLVFVSDLDVSLRFYRTLLLAEPVERDHSFALFECGFALHDGDALLTSIYSGRHRTSNDVWGRDNLALYFESDDLDSDHQRLAAQYELIHPLRTEPWGGRVFRLHDPDRHVVEVGGLRAQACA